LLDKDGKDSLRYDPAISIIEPAQTFKYVQGDAVLTGGEAVLNIHPVSANWFSWMNGFSMVNASQKNQPDSAKYLPYTPPYKFRSEMRFSLARQGDVFRNSYFKVSMDYYFTQDKIRYTETTTPSYSLVNLGLGTDIYSNQKQLCSLFIYCSNLGDVAYQSHMSRLKYGDINNVTGRMGVFNMGRSISFKLVIPINFKK